MAKYLFTKTIKMPKLFFKKSGGLVSVVVVALLTVFSVTLLFGASFIGIESKKSADDFYNKDKAKYLAFACAQDALLKLKNNAGYGGNETISVAGDNCQILIVQNLGGEQRIIKTQSVVDVYAKKIQINISALTPAITISVWNENASF